ncbi:hypothetical protein OAQ99_03070 [Candidatus Kapabacteria bacterium]|nr:hypothetical protein [Candidatus Kapabacteria bacterium]
MILKIYQLLKKSSVLLVVIFLFSYKTSSDENFRILYNKILNDTIIEDFKDELCVMDSTSFISNLYFSLGSEIIEVYNLDKRYSVYNKKFNELNDYENTRDSIFSSEFIVNFQNQRNQNCKYMLQMDKYNDSIYLGRIVITNYYEFNFLAKIINQKVIHYVGGSTNICILNTKDDNTDKLIDE